MHPEPAGLADFLSTSNFDLWYFCSLLTYKDAQYLIWKIWFIYVWSQRHKAVVWLLTGFMLGQSTPISYHTEANGCIFFAASVHQPTYANVFVGKSINMRPLSMMAMMIFIDIKSHTVAINWTFFNRKCTWMMVLFDKICKYTLCNRFLVYCGWKGY